MTARKRAAKAAAEVTAEAPEALVRIRERIRRVDEEIVALVARRVELAREAGRVKREADMPLVDETREREVMARARELADASGLPRAELRALFDHLIALSRRAQEGRGAGGRPSGRGARVDRPAYDTTRPRRR